MARIIGTMQGEGILGTDEDGGDVIRAKAGDDVVSCEAGDDHVYGDRGEDYLDGGIGNDRMEGAWGDDEMWGGAGSDWMIGGRGHDQLYGGTGIDVVSGERGNDLLALSAEGGVAYGGVGDDWLTMGFGGDPNPAGTVYLFGETGRDGLSASTGFDRHAVLTGGVGDDLFEATCVESGGRIEVRDWNPIEGDRLLFTNNAVDAAGGFTPKQAFASIDGDGDGVIRAGDVGTDGHAWYDPAADALAIQTGQDLLVLFGAQELGAEHVVPDYAAWSV